MAAGATIGSNHNSRGADGEIQAGRGFWPGLCVSLKHNSRFASFTMIAKGNYPAELDIPFPFSLISNEEHSNKLVVMPAYWFMYNMYAIQRNERKFAERDKRIDKFPLIEFNCLAPDTINEIYQSLGLLELLTGKAFYKANKMIGSDADYISKGKSLLEHHSPVISGLDIRADGFENSKRPVQIIKVEESYIVYKKMLCFYAGNEMIRYITEHSITDAQQLLQVIETNSSIQEWVNAGGLLITKDRLNQLLSEARENKINGWEGVHNFYKTCAEEYPLQKMRHAVSILLHIDNINSTNIDNSFLRDLFQQTLEIKEWITKSVYHSKAKDYKNTFKNMVYDSKDELESVLGSFEDNSFIIQQNEELAVFKEQVAILLKTL